MLQWPQEVRRVARKISMIDLAGIGNLLEYLVAADNITCEERDRIILRIAKENDIAEYTLSALAGYGKSKSEVLESVARRKNSVSQDKNLILHGRHLLVDLRLLLI